MLKNDLNTLKNAILDAKIAADTAANEHAKVCPVEFVFRFPKVLSERYLRVAAKQFGN